MQHEYWQEAREYSKAEAFLYLIMRAAWEDRTDGYGYKVKRGEVVTTISQLSHDWSWGKSRVRRFLLAAQAGSQVSLQTDRERTKIRISNYEKYQALESDREPKVNRKRTTNEPQVNCIIKKEEGRTKKEEDNTSISIPLPASIDTFEVRSAIQRWLSYKAEKRQSYKPTGLTGLIGKLSKFRSAESVIASIEHCIASNYDGIFEQASDKPAARKEYRSAAQARGDEHDRAIARIMNNPELD